MTSDRDAWTFVGWPGPRVNFVPNDLCTGAASSWSSCSSRWRVWRTEQLHCSYVVLLSGQDYPLCRVRDLEAELAPFDVWTDAAALPAGRRFVAGSHAPLLLPLVARGHTGRRLLWAWTTTSPEDLPASDGRRRARRSPGRPCSASAASCGGGSGIPPGPVCRSTKAARGCHFHAGPSPPSCPPLRPVMSFFRHVRSLTRRAFRPSCATVRT